MFRKMRILKLTEWTCEKTAASALEKSQYYLLCSQKGTLNNDIDYYYFFPMQLRYSTINNPAECAVSTLLSWQSQLRNPVILASNFVCMKGLKSS